MTDPNMPPTGPPSANQPPPGYAPPAAPGYQQQQQPYGQAPAEKYNVLSIISLVTGILGISLVAIITGHIGLSQIGRTQEKGRGFSIAGLVLGYLGLLLGLAVALIWITVLVNVDSIPTG